MEKTIFKLRKTLEWHFELPYLYTPNESLCTLTIENNPVCNMFCFDEINKAGLTRTILFDFKKEEPI